MQRTEGLATNQHRLCFLRLLEQVGRQSDDGIELAVQPINLREMGVYYLNR